MLKEVINSDIGESYVKAVHSSGLKIYILEKRKLSRLLLR
jgi:predicted Fe-Mo cluster-binding NifX family protein